MKKNWIILSFIIFNSSLSFSQTKWFSFEVGSGATQTRYIAPGTIRSSYLGTFAPVGFANVFVNISERMSFGTGLHISNRNSRTGDYVLSSSIESFGSVKTSYYKTESKYVSTLSYFEIPFNLKFMVLTDGQIRPYIIGSMIGARLLKDEYTIFEKSYWRTYQENLPLDNKGRPSVDEYRTLEYVDQKEKSAVGFSIGAGVHFKKMVLESGHAIVQGRSYGGRSNVGTYENRSWYYKVAYSF